MAGYDIEGARQAGISDADIAGTLAPRLNYDLDGARRAGVADRDIADALANRFNTTQGGAATGNPSIEAQGDRMLRSGRMALGESVGRIGFSTGLGAGLGAAAPEILTGLGTAVGAYPPTRPLAPWLLNAGQALRGSRGASAATGAASGAISEIAGQGVEAAGGGPTAAELARIAAGGIGPELKTLAYWAVKKTAGASGVTDLLDAARKYLGKDATLSERQQAFLREEIEQLRGQQPAGVPQTAIHEALEEEGSKGIVQGARAQAIAGRQVLAAQSDIGGVPGREVSDIGSDLRDVIVKRNEGKIAERAKQYKATEAMRDAIVQQKEANGEFLEKMPEYKFLVRELEGKLLKTRDARMGSATLKVSDQGTERSLQNILDAVSSRRVMISESEAEAAAAKGYKVVKGTDPSTGEPAIYREFPTSFHALDDVRRRLGDVFRGKPDEGYAAIGADNARHYYGRISEIQKKYAGAPQEKLLDDYAAATEGLQVFRSKAGKKATALDRFDEAQFATDAAALPKSYFRNKDTVRALIDLTGDRKLVNKAALEFVNSELSGKDGAAVMSWLSKNSDWLREMPLVRVAVAEHGMNLQMAERSARVAGDAARAATERNKRLVGDSFPVERVKELIESGNVTAWKEAGPVIAASPQARAAIGDAVRQTLASKAERSARGLQETFANNIRPALENARLMSGAELDIIAGHLARIEGMKIPEQQKLGLMNRVLLQTVAGYTADVGARVTIDLGKAARDRMIPQ